MVFAFQWVYGQDPPSEFSYNISTLQAFYFFDEVTLNGDPIELDDWVAAFKGDVCVGARLWGACGGDTCDVLAGGNDGSQSGATAGYMETGDVPTFKIYDASENAYYEASTSEVVESWSNNGFFFNVIRYF